MINIAIVGVNEKSKRQAEKLLDLKEYNLVGFYEHDDASAKLMQDQFNLNRFDDFKDLIRYAEAVNIQSPVGTHFRYASEAIRQLKHVFVKQVLSESLDEAKELNQLADEANVQLYVSHHEKFHPNYQLLKKLVDQPFYIESSRFDPNLMNYTAENLVFDLLLTDLELVMQVVKAKVRRVRATGACLHHSYMDFINVRIEFDNGCVLNMVCGNFKSDQPNKMSFFQKHNTYHLNLDQFQITMLNKAEPEQTETVINKVKAKQPDMIKKELEYFAQSISTHSLNLRTHYDNYQTLELAHLILDRLKINKR